MPILILFAPVLVSQMNILPASVSPKYTPCCKQQKISINVESSQASGTQALYKNDFLPMLSFSSFISKFLTIKMSHCMNNKGGY